MINYTIRFVKRFAVLVPGIVIAYFSVHDIYPAFDKRVSELLAILFTYIIAAYILIPAVIRVLRIFIRPKHLPHYCVTPDGFASDPINIGLVGTREELVSAMKSAGWFVADPHSLRNTIRGVVTAFSGYPYPTAPMSSLYLFGRKQDIGFELPIKGKRGHRHHVRFWATASFDGKEPLQSDGTRWVSRKKRLEGEKMLWLGAASRDIGFALIRHNAQVTHMIDPDTNQERELIIKQLKKANDVKFVEEIRLGNPYRLVNRAWRGYLQSDGMMKVYKL